MKKNLLLATLLVLSTITNAQTGFPTEAQAEKFIETDKSLHKEVEKQMGTTWDKLEVKSDGWKGYKGTPFSLTTTECGQSIRARGGSWPEDAAFAKWIVTGPKNSKGIYKVMGIYLDYDRTSDDGEYCRLGSWKFEGYRLESATEYGHKEFSLEEMKSLFYTEAKAGRIDALKYFIEIQEPQDTDFRQNVPQPGQRYIWVYFEGTMARYAPDHSVVFCESPDTYQVQLSLSEEEGVWRVAKSTLLTPTQTKYELSEFQNNIDQYCEFPETAINYESYQSAGWDAVFKKRTPLPADQGKYGQLKNRIDELYTMLKEKGTDVTEADLKAFILPSRIKEVENNQIKIDSKYYLPFQTEPKETSLDCQKYNFSGAFILAKEYDGRMLDIAFPGTAVQFFKSTRKSQKKWEVSSVNPINTRSSIVVSEDHSQPWFYENGQWYLYDFGSIYFESEDAKVFLKKLLNEESSSSEFGF
ncbi:MAG: hypothetical protein R3277_00175 [Brumimicrobium sp.]|nr:hypothetical protein [Brumimicrobium sp.]